MEQIGLFIKDFPETITNFENSDFYAWIESTFGDSVGQLLDEAEKFITNPANIAAIGGGVLKIGVTIAHDDLGPAHHPRAEPVLPRVDPGHEGLVHAPRAGAQPAEGRST